MKHNGNKLFSQDSPLIIANGCNGDTLEMHCKDEDFDDIDCVKEESIIKIRSLGNKYKYLAIDSESGRSEDDNLEIKFFAKRRMGPSKSYLA